MRKILPLLILTFGQIALPAQQFDANWPLGINAYPGQAGYGNVLLHFQPDSVQIVASDLRMNFETTAAAISDAEGYLLFYTNGCTIANAAGDTLPGGEELNPGAVHDWVCPQNGYVSPRGAMFLPAPGNPENDFYLLHMGMRYAASGGWSYGPFYFSLIHKNSNGGQGAVSSSNTPLQAEAALEPFTVVRHGNGRDWWIIVPEYGSNRYFRFLLSPSGVADAGSVTMGPQMACTRLGSSVFSADGHKFARTQNCRTVVFDFDRCTGLLGNPVEFVRPDYVFGGGGVGFDPAGHRLFVSEQLAILNADLTVLNPVLDTLVGVNDTYGAGIHLMQYGPDGRLYFNILHRSRFMPVLSELSDSLPVYEKKGLSLGVYSVRSLPNFPNYRLYDFPDSPCDTLGIDTPVAVKEPLANLSIKAYPNPVTDTWYLEAGFSSGRLHIFDFSGRMIRQIDWAGSADNLQVLVHDWPAGMYYWHWQPESGEVQSGWFVKM